MPHPLAPVEVFCSYAHEDEQWLRKLETHLNPMKRQGLISLWHDRLITGGTDWSKAIDTNLETASIILFLVSANFFASDYCYGVEMKRALERQETEQAIVIPILVRSCDWKGALFAHLQVLPTNAAFIASQQDIDAAFTDVATGIRRAVEDLSQFKNSTIRRTLSKVCNVPYTRNPFFLGRDEDIARIHSSLHAGQATALSQPQAISGLGGIGKTQLALEYAYRYTQDYTAVLWARADTTEAIISSYVAFADLLNLPEQEAKEQDIIVEAVKRWLQDNADWLLILDNADELKIVPGFLPPKLGGHLILTTRAEATGRLAQRIEIKILSPEQGALLLLQRSRQLAADAPLEQASSEERALAIGISQELGGLPLALDQAGAYIEETSVALEKYWQLYQRYRTRLLRERKGGFIEDHPLPVATTWSLSFEQVKKRNPAAAELLQILAWLPPDELAEEIFSAGAEFLGPTLAPVAEDEMLFNEAIASLRAYSLIGRDAGTRSLSIHRLVQAVLQDGQTAEEQQEWKERVVRMVNTAFPYPEFETWKQCERLLPAALIAAGYIEQQGMEFEEVTWLLYYTASYLDDRARYEEAEPLYQQALRIWAKVGPEQLNVAYPLNGLAILYADQGKLEQAEPLYQQSLRIRKQQLGPDHPDVATSLNNLASLYREQGKLEQAEPLYQQSLRIREQVLGAEHPKTKASYQRLKDLQQLMNEARDADSQDDNEG